MSSLLSASGYFSSILNYLSDVVRKLGKVRLPSNYVLNGYIDVRWNLCRGFENCDR